MEGIVLYEEADMAGAVDSPADILEAFARRDRIEEQVAIERVYLRTRITRAGIEASIRRDNEALRKSMSFLIGNAIVLAIRQPGRNTLLLPFRLFRLLLGVRS